MKKRSLVLAAGALLGLSSAAMAQFTALNAGPLDSNGPAGDALNGMFTFNYAGPAFSPLSIDFSGDLTEVNTATWASEARWRITNPAGAFADFQVSLTNGYTGTLNIATQLLPIAPFNNAADSVGMWTFQAFESFDDASDLLPDSSWSNISFAFNATGPMPVPTFNNDFTTTPNVLTNGVTVAGTTIWDDQNPQPGLTDGGGEFANFGRYGTFGWDLVGNEVAYRIDHGGGDLQLDLTDLTADLDMVLVDASGTTAGVIAESQGFAGTSAESILLAGAAPGTYYAVVDTFGSGAGGDYNLTYIPAPGAIALMGLGGLVATRRRR